MAQPGAFPAAEVGLGRVAGDHALRVEPHPGQEHQHLLGGGVLRLVEDDESVVQRPSPHESQRCDFDHVALDQRRNLVEAHHIVERVVEGAQIGHDLLFEAAGQEAEILAGLPGRAGQDDPAHIPFQEFGDRHRHRQIGLAGPGRTDPEHHIPAAHGPHVFHLAAGTGHHLAFFGADGDSLVPQIAQVVFPAVAEAAAQEFEIAGFKLMFTQFVETGKLFEKRLDAGGFRVAAPDFDPVVARDQFYVEDTLQITQVLHLITGTGGVNGQAFFKIKTVVSSHDSLQILRQRAGS